MRFSSEESLPRSSSLSNGPTPSFCSLTQKPSIAASPPVASGTAALPVPDTAQSVEAMSSERSGRRDLIWQIPPRELFSYLNSVSD